MPKNPLRLLWPLVALDVLVLASLWNPSFRALSDGASTLYIQDRNLPRWSFLPSTARPDLSLNALWFFNATYLSCFNIALVVQRRRALRALLLVVAANAVVLAIFGTFQKLTGATALYFGAIKTPQPYFFSTFIYHNHWGAFTVLMTAITIGLVFHYWQQTRAGFWRSPAAITLVGIALLATTIPLSTSRSATLLEGWLLIAAVAAAVRYITRHRRATGRRLAVPLAAAFGCIALFGVFTYELARPTIRLRLENTRDQLADLRARGETMPRQVLYRDTWNLARDKLWLGWGMGSYPTAFYHRNTQHESSDGPVRLFHDAHSDWLQSISEVGLIGTALLGLCGILPLYRSRRHAWSNPLSTFLLAGCSLIVLYALLEFPLGNRAVVIGFWLCFFCAIRYGELTVQRVRQS